MANKSPEPKRTPKPEEKKPGFYESVWTEEDAPDYYPGFIQFPFPLMWHQLDAWWEKAITQCKGIAMSDRAFLTLKWEASRDLLFDNDGWHMKNLKPSDLKANVVSLEVMNWVIMLCESYVMGQITPKVRLSLPSII